VTAALTVGFFTVRAARMDTARQLYYE
jgi:hypothetical protein